MQSRRNFLKSVSITGAGLMALNPRAAGAGDRVILALIGGHNRGKQLADRFIDEGAVIKWIVDVDGAVADEVGELVRKQQGRPVYSSQHWEPAFEDPEVDAVIIATPDHWHTHLSIWACQAGKDVYVEKPLCQRIREGQLICKAARRYKRKIQVGLQRRSGAFYHAAADYVASGKLGKLCLIKCWVAQVRPSIGNPPDCDPPPTVDYNLWLGPAPQRPFNPNRFHYNWRFFWDYGNAEIGNMGVHAFDLALMAIEQIRGSEHALPRRISDSSGIYWLNDAKEVPDTQVTTFDYGDFLLVWELRSFAKHVPPEGLGFGVAFYGSEGALILGDRGWKVFDPKNRVVASHDPTPVRHELNFIEAIQERASLNCDVEVGRRSTMLSHLGNISCWLRRTVEFDPQTETFGSDSEANRFLSKAYREGFELPEV